MTELRRIQTKLSTLCNMKMGWKDGSIRNFPLSLATIGEANNGFGDEKSLDVDFRKYRVVFPTDTNARLAAIIDLTDYEGMAITTLLGSLSSVLSHSQVLLLPHAYFIPEEDVKVGMSIGFLTSDAGGYMQTKLDAEVSTAPELCCDTFIMQNHSVSVIGSSFGCGYYINMGQVTHMKDGVCSVKTSNGNSIKLTSNKLFNMASVAHEYI